MNPKLRTIIVTMLSIGAMVSVASGIAAAANLVVPQSLKLEHEAVVDELARLESQGGAVGAAAGKALSLAKTHFAKESEFVFPPLSILPALSEGRTDPDMKAAIGMAERAKAAQAELRSEHVEITSLMNELIAAGKADNNQELMSFASRVAAHSLNEIEVLLPATIVIGDYLRGKLPANK